MKFTVPGRHGRRRVRSWTLVHRFVSKPRSQQKYKCPGFGLPQRCTFLSSFSLALPNVQGSLLRHKDRLTSQPYIDCLLFGNTVQT